MLDLVVRLPGQDLAVVHLKAPHRSRDEQSDALRGRWIRHRASYGGRRRHRYSEAAVVNDWDVSNMHWQMCDKILSRVTDAPLRFKVFERMQPGSVRILSERHMATTQPTAVVRNVFENSSTFALKESPAKQGQADLASNLGNALPCRNAGH